MSSRPVSSVGVNKPLNKSFCFVVLGVEPRGTLVSDKHSKKHFRPPPLFLSLHGPENVVLVLMCVASKSPTDSACMGVLHFQVP